MLRLRLRQSLVCVVGPVLCEYVFLLVFVKGRIVMVTPLTLTLIRRSYYLNMMYFVVVSDCGFSSEQVAVSSGNDDQ